MKKINLWIATVASIVFFFGNYFKAQHWPGAGVLMVVGAALGLIFLIMYLFDELGKLSTGIEKNTGLVGGITMIFVLVGFVFKIQHWPGANVFVYLAHALLLIFCIFLLVDAFKESDGKKQVIKAFAAFIIFTFNSITIMLGLAQIMNH